MKILIVLALFLGFDRFGFAQKAKNGSEKLKSVETGLVGFTSPESMFYPEKFDSPERKSLESRMVDFKVPGVSLAIIDRNRVVATGKGCGGDDQRCDGRSACHGDHYGDIERVWLVNSSKLTGEVLQKLFL